MIRPGALIRSPFRRRGALGALVALALTLGLFLAPPLAATGPAGIAPVKRSSFAIRRHHFLQGALDQAVRLGHAVPDIGAQANAEAAIAAAALAADKAADGPDRAAETNRYLALALRDCERTPRDAGCERGSLLLARLLLEHRGLLQPELATKAYSMLAPVAAPPGPAALSDVWDFAETENQRMVAIARAIGALALSAHEKPRAGSLWQRYAAAFLRARLANGWYEQDSPGYLAISINALLLIADHAPDSELRALARHALDVLFATWAQDQVAGYPAGPKTRTYMSWALSDRSSPWAAWYWLVTGRGEEKRLSFINSVDLAVAHYTVPAPIVRVAADRRRRSAYPVLARRRIEMARRRNLDAALYSWATPDYILSVSQAVQGLLLAASGGQEISVALYPEGAGFAPLYLWSRASTRSAERWKSYAQQDLSVGDRNLAVGRFGGGRDPGYAYLAPGWSRPVVAGDVATTRIGSTQVALVTRGGWTLARAKERFPSLYGSRFLTAAWILMPRRQPAIIGLEAVGGEDPGPEAFRRATRRDRVTVDDGEIRFAASDSRTISFRPGVSASLADGEKRRLDARAYPILSGPFFSRAPNGDWKLTP